MFAALPMYARAETNGAQDALWADVCARLDIAPFPLDQSAQYDSGWGRPDLVLGQICNLPYRAQFSDRVKRIGSSDYGLPDTPPGYYHSVFVVRAQDAPRGLAPATLGRFAYNDALSQSGWGAPLATVTQMGLQFHTTVRTGAHSDSLRAVAENRADLTAVDAVSWRMMQRWDAPLCAKLCVIGRTRATPGQTFITAKTNDPEPIRKALSGAIAGLSAHHRDILGLRGIVELPDAAFAFPCAPAPRDAPNDALQLS